MSRHMRVLYYSPDSYSIFDLDRDTRLAIEAILSVTE